jgi:hypothetical protein
MTFLPVFRGMNMAALQVAAAGGGDAILDTLQVETDGLVIDGLLDRTLVRTSSVDSASTPAALLTYSSPSAKFVMNSTGTLVSGSAIRTDYNAAGTPLGILVEEARTNYALQSQTFNNASWTKGNCAISADSVDAPDGTTTADTLTANAGSASHAMYSARTVSGTNITLSVYVKKNTHRYVSLASSVSGGTDWAAAVFDLDGVTGEATQTTGGTTGTVDATSQVDCGDGWFRLTSTITLAGNNNNLVIEFAGAATGNSHGSFGNITYNAAGTESIYVWGAQREVGAFETSYVPTTTVGVARNADIIQLATSSFPWSATNGMLVVKARPLIANSLGGAVSVNDGSGNEEIVLYRDASGNLVYQVEDGGANQLAPLDSTANASNATAFTMAAAYKANDFALSAGGGAAQTDTGGTLPTVTTLEVGANQANNYFNGHIQWIKYVPRDVSDAELVSDSAL